MSNKLVEYSNSRIFRKCGQLGIPYEEVINSPYMQSQGKKENSHRVQYNDGKKSTVGWGDKKVKLEDKHIVPFEKKKLRSLLGI